MSPRFEVVSAPIEERLQSTLQTQVFTLVSTLRSIFSCAEVHRVSMSSTLKDEAFVSKITITAAKLALPSSVPGALFVCFVVLKLASAVLVRVFARRALRHARHVKLN
jgi:hypothetical protein